MRGNPILNSLRAAETAGYPALLIVSAVCLGLVVAPVALLGLTDAGWVLGLAVLYLIVAIAVLVSAVGAALSEGDEPDAEGQAPGGRACDESNPVERRLRAGRRPGASSIERARPSPLPARIAHAPAGGPARRHLSTGRARHSEGPRTPESL